MAVSPWTERARAKNARLKKDGSLDDNKKSAPIICSSSLFLSLFLSLSLNFAFSRGPGGGFVSLSLSVDFFENFPYEREREREKSFCVF